MWTEENGISVCQLATPPDHYAYRLMDTTVIKPPSSIELYLRPKTYFVDGDILQATCIIRDVRPFIPITNWYLGDKILTFVPIDTYTLDEVWTWPWDLQTVVQNISIEVSLKDDGLKLRCVAEHAILNMTFQKSHVIRVHRSASIKLIVDQLQPPFSMDIKKAYMTSVLCQSDVPLSECQFKITCIDTACEYEHIVDFSDGNNLKELFRNSSIYLLVKYNGKGIKYGDCGMSMHRLSYGSYRIGCRGRAKTGGWAYAETNLHSISDSNAYNQLASIYPRSRVTTTGATTKMLCQGQPFTDNSQKAVCYFTIPAKSQVVQFSGSDSVTTDGSSYYGQGLQVGHCGIRIGNVTEENNGPHLCKHETRAPGYYNNVSIGMDTIVVAKLPSKVDLIVNGREFIEGDMLNATCKIWDSRPASLITWYLGDEVIRRDAINDERDEDWRWSWDTQTTTQHVTIRLSLRHDSMFLRCVAETLALNASIEEAELVLVNHHIPPGYEQVCGFGIYKLHPEVRSKDEAEATCVSEGTRLASVDSELECDILVTMIQRHSYLFDDSDDVHVYIEDNISGGVRNVQKGVNGKLKHAPNTGHEIVNKQLHRRQQDCTVLSNFSHAVIAAEDCTKENAFICEKKLSGESSIRLRVVDSVAASACFLHNLTAFIPLPSKYLDKVAEKINNLLLLNRTYFLHDINSTTIVHDYETILTKVVLDESNDVVVIDKSKVSLVVADVRADVNPVQGIFLYSDLENSFKTHTSVSRGLLIEDVMRIKSENLSFYIRSPKLYGIDRLAYTIYAINSSFSRLHTVNGQKIKNSRVINIVYYGNNSFNIRDIFVGLIFKPTNRKVYRKAELQSCASWDMETRMWSTDGCELQYRKNILRACRCIFQPRGYVLNSSYSFLVYDYRTIIPKPLSLIGVALKQKYAKSDLGWLALWSLSAFGLLSIAMTGLVFKTWRQTQSNKILLQMSFSTAIYLSLNVFFLIFKYDTSIDDYQRSDLTAISFSFLIRYSFLTQSSWVIVLSSLQLKRLLNVLGTSTTENLMFKVSAFAWGAPLLPLIVLLSWDRYQHMCVDNPIVYYCTIVATQTSVVFVNMVILVYVTFYVCACCGCGEKTGLVRHGITDWTLALRRLKQIVFLFFLFGIPTSFELIYLFVYTNEIFLFLYRFTDTLQGCFLFIFFILVDEEVRNRWKEVIFD